MEKKCFLHPRLHLKSPNRWDHQAGTLQKQLLQSSLAKGGELSSSPWSGDVAWLISNREWSSKKTTTWICPFCPSVDHSATTRMNGWMLFPLNQHQSCRSQKYCELLVWSFLMKLSLLFCFSVVVTLLLNHIGGRRFHLSAALFDHVSLNFKRPYWTKKNKTIKKTLFLCPD